MFAKPLDLLKNPNFVLKIVELVLVLVGFVFVVLSDPFIWPNSVTMVLCMDTGTYSIILIVILSAYVLEQPHRLIEFCFSIFGVGLFLMGSVLAFSNYKRAAKVDQEASNLDFSLGIVLSVITVAMTVDTFLNGIRMRKTRYLNTESDSWL